MKIVLYCLEKHIEQYRKVTDALPHVLNGFYENCILDEERILKWCDKLDHWNAFVLWTLVLIC